MEEIAEWALRYWKWLTSSMCILAVWFYSLGSCDDQNWLIVQYPWGNVKVIDSPGWFFKAGASCWYYPRNWQVEYDKDFSFNVVFNDGGSATMNAMVRFSSPMTIEGKRKFHQLFGGSESAVEAAVWAHLSDSMKSSGPVMSASEHQSARRGEFTALVQDQLQKGLFEMRRVSRVLQDQFDDKGKPITVYATEVVTDDGNVVPKISRSSPISDFGILITQFSITDVVYDSQTQKQFSQKKEAFLAAEGSKAQREKEVQERLMVEERGRREKAETESLALRQKAEAVIKAQRERGRGAERRQAFGCSPAYEAAGRDGRRAATGSRALCSTHRKGRGGGSDRIGQRPGESSKARGSYFRTRSGASRDRARQVHRRRGKALQDQRAAVHYLGGVRHRGIA